MADSSNMPTLEVSNAIRRLTMEETRDLMFQMGVPPNILKDIADEFKGEHRKQNFVQMWLDMHPDASWEKLVAGLRKINKNALAAEIESERLAGSPVHSSGSPLLSTSSVSASTQPGPQEAEIEFEQQPNDVYISNASSPNPDFDLRVKVVTQSIEDLDKEFSEIKFEVQKLLIKEEKIHSDFCARFRFHLLNLPVTKKQIHIKFFSRNEDKILNTNTIEKLFIILSRYCNYSNYEIIFHVIKRFCAKLKGRMLKYRDSLTSFEKATTVDVYLCAISARPGGEIEKGFIRMTVKINKPPSECTLYEIRELKEAVEEKASLESFATYIDAPGEGSVQVVLHVHEEVGWMVGVVFTTPDFRRKHLLMDVRIGEQIIMEYLIGELRFAAKRGDVKAVTSLITAGVNLNTKDKNGDTALMTATRKGRTEVVSLLLEAGANTDLQNKKAHSAVIIAVIHYHQQVLKELVRAGADLNLQDQEGLTALMISSRSGRTDLTETLLSGDNISLDIQDPNGRSALSFAIDREDEATTKLLLKAGAECHPRDENQLIVMGLHGDTNWQKKDDDRANQSADWDPEAEPPTLEQCPRGCMDCVVEVALEILQQCCCRRRVRGGSSIDTHSSVRYSMYGSSTLDLIEPLQTPRYGNQATPRGSRLGHSLFSIVGSLCCSFFDRT